MANPPFLHSNGAARSHCTLCLTSHALRSTPHILRFTLYGFPFAFFLLTVLCLRPSLALADAPPFSLAWSSVEIDNTTSVAWGDYDNDGDLDLAVGNGSQRNRLYRNDNGALTTDAIWSSTESDSTTSVAWGDYDNDGDLDLVVGNDGQPNRLYRNDYGVLTASAVWSSIEADATLSVAWGDYDGDSDVDLAVGNNGQPNRLYRNDDGILTASAIWSSSESDSTTSIAWGDYDGDGDLDLAVGNASIYLDEPSRLYRNDQGMLTASAVWSSSESDSTTSVAWGDYDGDSDLDLAVGTGGYIYSIDHLYRNDNGVLTTSAVWSPTDEDLTFTVAWGDYDSDGDLDLIAGNTGVYSAGEPNLLYRNDNGMLTASAVWSSTEADQTLSLAWGDYDGDGDLDVAVGNHGQSNRLYRNDLVTLAAYPAWQSVEGGRTGSVAWGDYDGDGDLDLVVGDGVELGADNTYLYRNDNSILTASAVWSSTERSSTSSVAWGDYDGDGDLDLALGNYGNNGLYRNDNGLLTTSVIWSSTEADGTTSVAWGDYDGDGDLDLAAGNGWSSDFAIGGYNRLYRNEDGVLIANAVWSSAEADATSSVAWGDYDGDGDLDLAVGNGCPSGWAVGGYNRLYRNDNGVLTASAVWSSAEPNSTTSVAWGDYDGDGDLDLAVGNDGQPNQVYRNDNGVLTASAVWSSLEADYTHSLAWGDYDGDGDLDLVVGNFEQLETIRFYRNDSGELTTQAVWSPLQVPMYITGVAWGDYDGDGDLDLAAGSLGFERLYRNNRDARSSPFPIPVVRVARPRPPANAGFYSSPKIWSGPVIPIIYTLSHLSGLPVQKMIATYSLNGGGQWLPAVAAAGTLTTNLSTSPEGTVHTYNWDVFQSGLMGQSDNIVFRLQAIPAITHTPNSVPGPYLYGSYASSTFPFRVRGSQVRVLSGTVPISNALVYRLPESQNGGGQPYASLAGQPFHTDGQGYLQGRGEIRPGDRLLALLPVTSPITWTDSCTLYHTNGIPTPGGLDAFSVQSPGVQTITVSSAYPLLLCDLHISLEWDASGNPAYLSQLASDLKGASRYLYDFTDGQVALSNVVVHQNGDQWVTSDVVIYATNRMRPLAVQGGVVLTDTTDRGGLSIVYEMGQVRMGATWNQFGDPSENSRDDWQRALAHELAHYLLFEEDTYLGLNEEGLLIPVGECTGSAMGDFYTEANTEFLDDSEWLPWCGDTLAQHTLGRSEWATLRAWYPGLEAGDNTGPSVMPFDFTTVSVLDPVTPTMTLGDVTFFVDYVAGSSSPGARAFLLRSDEGGEYVMDLGSPAPGQNRVLARGVREEDRLCVFDPSRSQYGCEMVRFGDDHLAMEYDPSWTPIIQVSPVETNALHIEVSGLDGTATLRAQLYPEYGYGTEPITLAYSDGVYSGTFDDLPYPPVVGHVQVWSESPGRETMAHYIIGGNPGENPFSRGHGPFSRGHGPFSRGHGPFSRGHGPFYRGSGAFVVSPDGQMSLFTPDPDFPEGAMYTIQTIAGPPTLPPGKIAIGPAYRLVSTGTPVITDATLSFQYLGVDVLREGVNEQGLRIHYWDGGQWRALETTVDTYYNVASAWSQGDGIYALLGGATIPVISAVVPASATNDVTTTLVISGSHFLEPVDVALLGPSVAYSLPVVAVSPVSVTAVVTHGLPAREYQVRVVNRLDGAASTLGLFALYASPPSGTCFYDFFESGPSKWQRDGQWEIAILPSGERVMTDSPAGNYNNAIPPAPTCITHITSQAFNLNACTGPTLTFRHDYVLAELGVSQDIARVEISTDAGATWSELARYTGGGIYEEEMEGQDTPAPEWTEVDWKTVEVDLGGYTGIARLRFSLEVDQTVSDKGWVIDDVVVRSGGPPMNSQDHVYLPIILK
jgi:hypothetical protein